VALTFPLCAVAPVPSMVALHPLVDSDPWILVSVMLTVFFVALKERALTGILPVIVTEMFMPSTEQPLTVSVEMVPMPAPDRPLPFLNVPFAEEEVQLTD